MRIGVDLRGLNYPELTGVNSYTIHMLYCLGEVKKTNPDLRIICVGLNDHTYKDLVASFPFLHNLFFKRISISTYFGLPFNLPSKLITLFTLIYFKLFKKTDLNSCYGLDILLCPQPKPICKYPDTQMITIFHDLYNIISTQTMQFNQRVIESIFVYRVLAENSFVVLANSMSTAFDLQNLLSISKSKIRLVYPSLPIWETIGATANKLKKTKKPIALPEKFMLCISGIEPRKNWLNVLKAFQQNQQNQQNFDYHLVLAGRVVDKQYHQTLLEYIRINNISDVHFMYDIDEQVKQSLYKHCDFFLYPSFYEGFGFPILESFAHKKPVITSKISSMPELAKSGALYVNPLNPHELAHAIQILSIDREFYSSLVSQSEGLVDEFSWGELEKNLQALLVVDEL